MALKKNNKKKFQLSSDLKAKEKFKEWLHDPNTLILLDSSPDSDTARMGSPFSYDRERGLLNIFYSNIDLLDEDIKNELLYCIRETHNSGYLINKESKLSEINSYKEYFESKDNNDILTFFKNIIPLDDYFALKTSLYIEYLAAKGINIYYHKKDLRDRYGKRGANIANLCSANYFRDVFMPLYNENPKDVFVDYYDLAVDKSAIALFVNHHMGVGDISEEVRKMVDKAKKYGLDNFNIHGKGFDNVSNINKFVKNVNPSEDGFVAKKEYEDPKNNIIVFVIALT